MRLYIYNIHYIYIIYDIYIINIIFILYIHIYFLYIKALRLKAMYVLLWVIDEFVEVMFICQGI